MARKPLVNRTEGGTPSFVDLFDFERPTNVTVREILIDSNSLQKGTASIGTALSNTFSVGNYGQNVEYLLVGGGGAGGKATARDLVLEFGSGGGGAGGVLHGTIISSAFGSSSQVIVGRGGNGGGSGGNSGGDTYIVNASGGTVLIAGGGGGGGGLLNESEQTLASATASAPGKDGTGGSSGGKAYFSGVSGTRGSGGAGGGAASAGNWSRAHTSQTTATHPLVGTKGLANFGGDPLGSGVVAEPGLGVTIMGYQVAAGGPGGSYATALLGTASVPLHGSSYGLPELGSAASTIDSRYGSGGRGGYEGLTTVYSRGNGGDGIAVFRYLDTKKNNADVWKRTNLTSVASGANEIKATAANGGTIIALTRGATPQLLRTTNYGASWSTVALPASPGATESAVYGGSLFVIGMANKIFASSDGSAWSTASLNAGTTGPYQVAYGNGAFIAAGLNGRVFTSPDGTAWATAATATTTAGTFNPIWAAYGTTQYGHTFIAGWEQNVSSATRYMRFSNDNIVGANSSAAAWSNFVQPTAGTIEHVAYGNGKFWGVFGNSGTAAALRYTDGTAWTAVGRGTATWTTGTVSYTGATVPVFNSNGDLATSARAQTNIAYAGGTIFVAAGPYFVLSKTEARTWEPRNATGFTSFSHHGSFDDALAGAPLIFDIRPLDDGRVLLAGGTVGSVSGTTIAVSISEP